MGRRDEAIKKRAQSTLDSLSEGEKARGRDLLKEIAALVPDAAVRRMVIQKAFALADLALAGMRRDQEQLARARQSELSDIASLLRMPVAPVKDASGRIIGAKRVPKLP